MAVSQVLAPLSVFCFHFFFSSVVNDCETASSNFFSLSRFRVAIFFLPPLYSRVVSESWSMMACLWGFEKIF